MSEDLSKDHELLVQLKHGNIAASEILYARYARKFYAHARNQGFTHEDAEDVSEQAFKKILDGGIATYKEDDKGGAGWMWQICKHVIADILRDPKKSRTVSINVLPEDVFVSEDINPALWQESKDRYAARYCAWKSISQEDHDVLSQKLKPGPRSKAWKAAQERLLDALEACLRRIL